MTHIQPDQPEPGPEIAPPSTPEPEIQPDQTPEEIPSFEPQPDENGQASLAHPIDLT